MCFEGMEENGSEGLEELIAAEAKKFFKDVDCVCISDNYWLGTAKPCLTVSPFFKFVVNDSMAFVV
jgi:Cys-Gly metallodipeptidase DUG1